MLSGPPVLVVGLSRHLTVGGDAPGLSSFLVFVSVVTSVMAPVTVTFFGDAALDVSQRGAAQALPQLDRSPPVGWAR